MKRLSASFLLLTALAAESAIIDVGPDRPLTLIQAALDAAQPGDVIRIDGGTYRENLAIKDDGLTLEPADSNTVTIMGRIDAAARTNVTIRNLDICAWSNGFHGISSSGGRGLRIIGCHIHDGPGVSSSSGIYVRHSRETLIESNTIRRCRKGINIVSARSTDARFETGTMIRGNIVENNPNDGIDLHGEYITVEANTIAGNMDTNWAVTHPDGIQLIAATVDGLTSVKHCRIYRNTVRNHTQNIFAQGTVGGEGSNCQDIEVVGNVAYNESATVNGVSMDSLSTVHIMANRCRDVRIYNNTLGRSGGLAVNIDNCADGSVFVKNNIIANNLNTGIAVQDPLDIAADGLDANLYWCRQSAIAWSGQFYATRLLFQAVTGLEPAGVDADPLVAEWPNPRPAFDSPAVNAGAALGPAYAWDHAGSTRPVDTGWDIGAFEVSPPPNAPTGLRVVTP